MFSIRMDTDSKCYFAAATKLLGYPLVSRFFLGSAIFVPGLLSLQLLLFGVSFLVGFFIGVNISFLPMHTLRLDGMPRRYITYAGFMSNYNRFCSFRALASIIFLYIGLAA